MNNFFNKNKKIIIGIAGVTLVVVGTTTYSLHARATFNNLKAVAESVGIDVTNKSNNQLQGLLDAKYAELDTNYNTLVAKANELGIDVANLSGDINNKITELNTLITNKENEIATNLEAERIAQEEAAKVEAEKAVAANNKRPINNNVVDANNNSVNTNTGGPSLNLPEVRIVNVGFVVDNSIPGRSPGTAAMIASGLSANELTFDGEDHNADGSIAGWAFDGSDGLSYYVLPNGNVEISKPIIF